MWFYSNKVTALCYASAERVLLSGGEDGVIVCWDMGANRKETAAWVESDTCQVRNCKIIINLIPQFNITTNVIFIMIFYKRIFYYIYINIMTMNIGLWKTILLEY